MSNLTILLTKTTAAHDEVALSYYSVRGLYFLGVAFAASIFTANKAYVKYFLDAPNNSSSFGFLFSI